MNIQTRLAVSIGLALVVLSSLLFLHAQLVRADVSTVPEASRNRIVSNRIAASGPVTISISTIVASGFDHPVHVNHAGDARLFVVEQPGWIQIIKNGAKLGTAFLDITDRVRYPGGVGEQGLLSVAFPPDYSSSGRFYVYYTNESKNLVISRFAVTANPDRSQVKHSPFTTISTLDARVLIGCGVIIPCGNTSVKRGGRDYTAIHAGCGVRAYSETLVP